MDDMERYETTERLEPTVSEDDDLERELRTYASARLSPDRFASARMRAAVLDHARAAQPPERHRLDVLAGLRIGVRRLAPIALVGAIAVSAGTAAGVAASPGGPLYALRIQIETALLPGGEARFGAQEVQLGERIDEFTGELAAGDTNGAGAAGDAIDQEVGNLISVAAQDRAELLEAKSTLSRHLAHFQSLVKPNGKSAANLQKLIAKTQAAIAEINAKLAAPP
jgi:hypothetical protein